MIFINYQVNMGALCKGEKGVSADIFEYKYGEDKKEKMIKHTDSIPCELESIRHNLDDCENRLKESEMRFKDVMISSQNLKLVSGNKEVPCHFQRPEHFLKRDADLRNKIYRIFSRQNCYPSNIEIRDDMMQYFGVFLCYLADHPELIEQIILTGPNSYGIAVIYMVHQSKRRPLYIDDHILCYQDYPIFSQPIKNTDMWPCLLEKAWFKYKSALNTSIDKIHPLELFKSFLMFPMRPVYLDSSPEENRRQVKKHLIDPLLNRPNSGTIVTSKSKPEHKIGLSGKKHFYLMKVFELDGNIYYYLRNPCGDFDFRGNLQLKDIPEELLQRIVKVTGEYPPPGNFLLNQQQFEEQIETFFVVKFDPRAPITTEFEIPFTNYFDEEVYLKFRINKDQPIGLRLHQLHKIRGHDPITALVLSVDRQDVTAGMHNEQACFGVQEANLLTSDMQTFMPGEYIIRLKRKSGQKVKEQDTTKMVLEGLFAEDILIANGNQEIDFRFFDKDKPMNDENKYQYKREFHDLLKEIGKKEIRDGNGKSSDDLDHIILWLGDIVILYIQKKAGGKDINNLEVNFSDTTNLNCITHQIGQGFCSLKTEGGQGLVIFEKKNLTEQTLVGKYSIAPY